MKVCNVEGCGRLADHLRRGMCDLHYDRWRRQDGDTNPRRNSPHKSLQDRLWAKADTSDPAACWVWEGGVNSKGYGVATRAKEEPGRAHRAYAHRLAWEEAYGPIPRHAQVDHICHERRCINPAHLRLATPRQNQENRKGAQINSQTGCRGVYPAPGGRYVVQVRGKHVGYFDTLDEATAAATETRRREMPYSRDARSK